jgi:hypothetical protein
MTGIAFMIMIDIDINIFINAITTVMTNNWSIIMLIRISNIFVPLPYSATYVFDALKRNRSD